MVEQSHSSKFSQARKKATTTTPLTTLQDSITWILPDLLGSVSFGKQNLALAGNDQNLARCYEQAESNILLVKEQLLT